MWTYKRGVRILDEAELENTKTDLQWYVPHLPVLNTNKSDNMRRVSNRLQSLVGIIFRFREKEIALSADVEAMFFKWKYHLQTVKYSNFCGETATLNQPISVYEYGRNILGAKSSPACVKYALQQVGRNCRDENGMVAKLINRNFYRDYKKYPRKIDQSR